MEQIIYVKRFIRSADDLPVKMGDYLVHGKNRPEWDLNSRSYASDRRFIWLNNVDYYLQPTTLAELIKEKLPSENDTIGESLSLKEGNEGCNAEWRGGFTTGVKYAINKLTE